ncbi:MAG: GGDEF domain-containing protein [Deltaproteobacteria bacterium]|nr:GGDEF domain-containing protein [Deltaproteobacteria bacterium]MCL5892244.1 GGDEF domain-containing protein [Deltaproteobacteria bacterium]
MEEYPTCEDLGYTFINELLEFANQRKQVEEIFHFVNVGFEYTFGATAIMFIYKKYNLEEKIEISRGISHEYVKKFNENPPLSILKEIKSARGGLYIDFKKEHEKYSEYSFLFEHDNVAEFYGYELKTAYMDSYFVIMYSVPGFKNCGNEKTGVFNTILSVLAYILNSNKCVQTMRDCSQIDYVSGLNNFKYFHEKLFQEMQKIANEKGILSLALISINQLNKLNSIFGHSAGDKNIGLIANIIKKHIRIFDIAARYGNKFIILFPGMDKNPVKDILKTIFSEVEANFKNENQDILSLNAGVSSFPADGNNERTVLDLAEGHRIDARRKSKWSIV